MFGWERELKLHLSLSHVKSELKVSTQTCCYTHSQSSGPLPAARSLRRMQTSTHTGTLSPHIKGIQIHIRYHSNQTLVLAASSEVIRDLESRGLRGFDKDGDQSGTKGVLLLQEAKSTVDFYSPALNFLNRKVEQNTSWHVFLVSKCFLFLKH